MSHSERLESSPLVRSMRCKMVVSGPVWGEIGKDTAHQFSPEWEDSPIALSEQEGSGVSVGRSELARICWCWPISLLGPTKGTSLQYVRRIVLCYSATTLKCSPRWKEKTNTKV